VFAWSVWLQEPAWHTSVVQVRPSSVQAVLLATLVHAVVLVAGWQVWHVLLPLADPAG
jgi:hypothetical protein